MLVTQQLVNLVLSDSTTPKPEALLVFWCQQAFTREAASVEAGLENKTKHIKMLLLDVTIGSFDWIDIRI